MSTPIPATIPVPDWLHDLIAEVTQLRSEINGPTTHEQTIRMALDVGLHRERKTLRWIKEHLLREDRAA